MVGLEQPLFHFPLVENLIEDQFLIASVLLILSNIYYIVLNMWSQYFDNLRSTETLAFICVYLLNMSF